MAAPVCAHVLLETVAMVLHDSAPSSGFGNEQASGDPDGDQRQELTGTYRERWRRKPG